MAVLSCACLVLVLSLSRKAAIAKAPKLQVTGRDVRLTPARPPRETLFPAKTNEVKRSIIWGSSQLLLACVKLQSADRRPNQILGLAGTVGEKAQGKSLPKRVSFLPEGLCTSFPSLPILQNCSPYSRHISQNKSIATFPIDLLLRL
jgi:hypothetical protein